MFATSKDYELPDQPMVCVGQTQRGEKERALPWYALAEIDMARSGSSLSGQPITEDQKLSVFARWGLT